MKRLLCAVVSCAVMIVLCASLGWAAPMEHKFPVTMKTTLPAGKSYLFTFELYDAAKGGTALWKESRRLSVPDSKSITHLLGSVKPFSAGTGGPVDFSAQLWVQVSGGGKTFPRLKLNAVPYALNSGSLSADAVTNAMITNGAVDDAKISGPVSGAKISGTVPDADTLDGSHAAAFAALTHDHEGRYYDKAYVDALESRLAALEAKLANVTADAGNVYITNANLHVRSGSGATDGAVNGKGNLIVGYNELRGSGNDDRTGSHNIIAGSRNNYTRYGGLVVGYTNAVYGNYASVSGGSLNTASGDFSSVSGGGSNTASYYFSSVSGGQENTASGLNSSVSGGQNNIASGSRSSVSSGFRNTASYFYSSVSGGVGNIASGYYSSVSGGQNNTAIGSRSSVSGGLIRSVSGDYDWCAGTYFQEQ